MDRRIRELEALNAELQAALIKQRDYALDLEAQNAELLAVLKKAQYAIGYPNVPARSGVTQAVIAVIDAAIAKAEKQS